MPKASKCFGRHATQIAINTSVAAENSGHVSGTVQHSQYECAVVELLEDDQEGPHVLPARPQVPLPGRYEVAEHRDIVIRDMTSHNFGSGRP
jgi:hypothetical protein